MEDNIGDMMVEIQNVVSNHLSNVKKDLQDTMNVINKLPLVIFDVNKPKSLVKILCGEKIGTRVIGSK